MITLDTTKAELREKWKGIYQQRKNFSKSCVASDVFIYGYFTGKMEYTAWLLVHCTEIDNTNGNGSEVTK